MIAPGDMSVHETQTGGGEPPEHRFGLLLVALAVLLIGYPYFEDTRTGVSSAGSRRSGP
jgi:hypothetical protein